MPGFEEAGQCFLEHRNRSRQLLKYFPVSPLFSVSGVSAFQHLQRDHIWNLRHARVDREDFVARCDLHFHRVGGESATGRLFRTDWINGEQCEHGLGVFLWHDEFKREEAGPLVVGVQRRAKGIDRFLVRSVCHSRSTVVGLIRFVKSVVSVLDIIFIVISVV